MESKKSHSIFERASEDFELQKSIVKAKSEINDEKDPGGPLSEKANEESHAAEVAAQAFHP